MTAIDIETRGALRLSRVTFRYPARLGEQPHGLFEDFDLEVREGERLAILGVSGSGKSTLGRLIAGMLRPSSGARWTVYGALSDVVYVDQHPMNSVFPWQTVRRNITYPLRRLRWSARRRQERVERLLSMFELNALGDAWPAELSGGQLQRVALARCLSWMPKFLVLDEALAALDARSRTMTVDAIKALCCESASAIVAITHDIADAYRLGHRCIVLGGRPARILLDLKIESNGSSRSRADFERAILETIHAGHL